MVYDDNYFVNFIGLLNGLNLKIYVKFLMYFLGDKLFFKMLVM